MSKPERVSNSNCSYYVKNKEEFIGSNMYAAERLVGSLFDGTRVYVVYSYGEHFPMWIYDYQTGQWYGNKDKFSITTSKQQNQSRPDRVSRWFDTDEMKDIVYNGGLTKSIAAKLTQKIAA